MQYNSSKQQGCYRQACLVVSVLDYLLTAYYVFDVFITLDFSKASSSRWRLKQMKEFQLKSLSPIHLNGMWVSKTIHSTISSPCGTVPFEKVRENIISQITDLMCRVDWHDHELRVWTALESLRSLLPAAEKGAGAA